MSGAKLPTLHFIEVPPMSLQHILVHIVRMVRLGFDQNSPELPLHFDIAKILNLDSMLYIP